MLGFRALARVENDRSGEQDGQLCRRLPVWILAI
jgi:hypothetical protein